MAGELTGVIASTGLKIPSMAGASNYVMYFVAGIAVAGFLGFIAFFIIQHMKYNQKIVLYKKINNKLICVLADQGMFQRVGKAGDFWLVTKKTKKKLPRPKIYMGKNLIWYFEREDGEWINFELGDMDEQMKKAGAYYVDEDMRLQRLGIQKNLDERLVKENFWDKYGTTIMWVMFVAITTVCLVVLFQKLSTLGPSIAQAAQAVEHMAVSVEALSSRVAGGVVPGNFTG